jgi:alpha-D-ribose 1-methylphosphonate 5-triphosphate diphosphatase
MSSASMNRETILTNASLVLRDQVLAGTIVLRGARIAEIQPGGSQAPGAIDLGGDYVIPGVVDLHTDNLERQVQPRSLARWPSRSAMVAHDAQCAAAGITTVLDALCLGDLGFDQERLRTFQDGIVDLDALTEAGLLKSDHYLHLRCEIPALDMLALFDPVANHPLVRMISLMDHSPGFGQYANVDFYRELRRRGSDLDMGEVERGIEKLRLQRLRVRDPNRRALLDRVSGTTIALASHDDRTVEEIAENAADGIRISEFPVTMEAAVAAKRAGMQVVAGAPNVVRGGSHSGNVAVASLVEAGAVDALASDYVPSSLIEAAFQIARGGRINLPDAVAMVSDHPARMSGLTDRGRLEIDLRADVVRVRVHDTLPIVRQVWSAGERVI